ncbi:MAG: NAD(P)-dependent glycerol-3-phosphate dehydrogenase [Alphaproteobacteria bacterium]|nr:NAD(P)-dependent glycerol-3-phosphate dehydrogenase [Alphaproteobacteria bacterium]
MTSQNDVAHVGVIGAGAWGTALAILANRASSRVTMWVRNSNVLESINQRRYNEAYLPDIFIDPAITATDQLNEACNVDVLILCVPSQSLRSTCIAISDLLSADVPVVIATKGIERGSLKFMSDLVSSILTDNPVAVLSGPNFADEAAKGLPTATTIACADPALGERLMYVMGGKYFRPYLTSDIIGTQIGGAIKNVIAIACGITHGSNMGENAKAALITRGLAEMARLCAAVGGNYQTLMGLSGIGDLMLTCNSPKSRNMSLGLELGKGIAIEEVLSKPRFGVTEGVGTAESVSHLAQNLGVAMPICNAVNAILKGELNVEQTIAHMLDRPFAVELIEG